MTRSSLANRSATKIRTRGPHVGATTPTPAMAAYVRRLVLHQAFRAGVGHIGSALSIADIIVTLYNDILYLPNAAEARRDRFVLSKGHAALALYATLFATGRITRAQLDTYCGDRTLLGVHPQHGLPFVEFTTGSLGQGLSWGVGLALANRIHKSSGRVFVLLSDGECNEGSVWESIMFASHQRLGNLYAIVDVNGQQALGYTRDVLNLAPLRDKWDSFGWDSHEIDGHSPSAITEAVGLGERTSSQPHVLLARTVFGAGVAFMESQIAWHYLPLSRHQYLRAMQMLRDETCEGPL